MSDNQFPPPPKTVPTITTDSSGEYDFDAEYNGCLTSLMQERDELKAQLTRLQERDREARERNKLLPSDETVWTEAEKEAYSQGWNDGREVMRSEAMHNSGNITKDLVD